MPASPTALVYPFPSLVNPDAARVAEETEEFVRTRILRSNSAAFPLQGITQAATKAFPTAGRQALRLLADWANLAFFIDDVFAQYHSDLEGALELREAVLSALSSPPAGDSGALPMLDALSDWWSRLETQAQPVTRQRFCRAVDDFLAASCWEIQNIARARLPDVESYLEQRLYTGATFTYMELLDLVTGLLPEPVYQDPTFLACMEAANLVTCYANDLFSHVKEQAEGDFHNVVILLQRKHGVSLELAIRQAVAWHDAALHTYHRLSGELLTRYPEILARLEPRFVAVEQMIVGHYSFLEASSRYRPTG